MRSLLLTFVVAGWAGACGGGGTPAPGPPGGEPPPVTGACIKTGCSGTVCAEPGNDVVTTCEMKPEYACYQKATCEKQPSGSCGWTETPELAACLASPPPL